MEKRTLRLERTFNAPRKLVWEAWSQPEHIASWWGPEGMETKVETHDFKPGGHWKYTMKMPNGKDFNTFGIFSEIVEYEKIVTSGEFPPMTTNVVLTATFEDDGDKTKFTFSVLHVSEEYCNQQRDMGGMKGWGSTFDRLGAAAEAMRS